MVATRIVSFPHILGRRTCKRVHFRIIGSNLLGASGISFPVGFRSRWWVLYSYLGFLRGHLEVQHLPASTRVLRQCSLELPPSARSAWRIDGLETLCYQDLFLGCSQQVAQHVRACSHGYALDGCSLTLFGKFPSPCAQHRTRSFCKEGATTHHLFYNVSASRALFFPRDWFHKPSTSLTMSQESPCAILLCFCQVRQIL